MSQPVDEAHQTSDAGSASHEATRHHGWPARFESILTPKQCPDVTSDLSDDMEEEPLTSATDEPAQNLLELSISHAATRIRSSTASTAEKEAAVQELDSRDRDDNEIDTPTSGSRGTLTDSHTDFVPSNYPIAAASTATSKDVPSPPTDLDGTQKQPHIWSIPPIEPWQAGPKSMILQTSDHRQSSLSGLFERGRKSSLSSSTDALKKLLPKGLPSMSHVGNLLGSLSAKVSPTLPRNHEFLGNSTQSESPPSGQNQHRTESSDAEILGVQAAYNPERGNERLRPLRRVASDTSLLYSTLSRSSSLGDDARFTDHREQINSRVKAIKDTLQDRSSFKLPQIPNILPTVSSLKKTSPHSHSLDALAIDKSVIMPKVADDLSVPSHLEHAMDKMTGDVVIMGGYRGSVLRSTVDGRQVWVPVKVGLNIRKVNLEVGLEPEDEERMEESIFASGMLQNIGPIDISRRLFKRLRRCENVRAGKLRVWDYGYDWRLSPSLLSRKLSSFLENLPSNLVKQDGSREGALVIAHSLGGLLSRHVANSRPELFSGIIYAGVPHSCVNILGPIRNGDAVLLSSRVLTAQVNFTLRTSFLLLPEDGRCFVDNNTKAEYPVDFFNVDDWIRYRWSPCTGSALPPQQSSGPLESLLNMSGNLLSLPLPIPGKRLISSQSPPKSPHKSQHDVGSEAEDGRVAKASQAADSIQVMGAVGQRSLEPQFDSGLGPAQMPNSVSTAVTIPRDKAIAYLRRTLADTKKFKQELYFKPELSAANRYPPVAVIYGKSIPTCNGAKVDGRAGIGNADAYDKLAFASGDGVVLAREAMLPKGYQAVLGGRIRSDRGHISLLGDLEAVGRALEAVLKGRAKGIGQGTASKK